MCSLLGAVVIYDLLGLPSLSSAPPECPPWCVSGASLQVMGNILDQPAQYEAILAAS
jgi:hypothetical protein